MRTKNVKLRKGFSQVCCWPGILLVNSMTFKTKKEAVRLFENAMKKTMGTRVQYLEEIITNPGQGGEGGRNDLFFAVHHVDVSRFAVPRLAMGIRWIEDAIAEVNGGCDLYPERVKHYCSW